MAPVLFTKTASRGTSYKDDSEDRGDKRRRERVLTFQCRATKRPGAIPLESKNITFLPSIWVVTVDACWHSAERQGLPKEWPSQNVQVKSRVSWENALQTKVPGHCKAPLQMEDTQQMFMGTIESISPTGHFCACFFIFILEICKPLLPNVFYTLPSWLSCLWSQLASRIFQGRHCSVYICSPSI